MFRSKDAYTLAPFKIRPYPLYYVMCDKKIEEEVNNKTITIPLMPISPTSCNGSKSITSSSSTGQHHLHHQHSNAAAASPTTATTYDPSLISCNFRCCFMATVDQKPGLFYS